MAFEKSPSLDEFENGIPQKLSDPSARRKRLRIIIMVLIVLVLGGLLALFSQSDAASILDGRGSISGRAVDDLGNPFQGYIFILGTDLETQTQPDGSFLIENVPAGMQKLILANEYAGYEFPVQVIAGDTVAIGQIQFISTATP